MYMVYIRPLTDRWEADRWELYGKMAPPSDFIWHNETGPWESSRSRSKTGAISLSLSARSMLATGGPLGQTLRTATTMTSRSTANYGVTIDVLKRLTAESLDIFGQVSRRWHKFLGCDAQQQSALEPPLLTSSSKRKGAAESGGEEKKCYPPRKRAKIASLETLRAVSVTPARRGRQVGRGEAEPAGCRAANGRREELGLYGPGYASRCRRDHRGGSVRRVEEAAGHTLRRCRPRLQVLARGA
ncbi:uncharacterized protein NECHADRAFT_88966 [Fusarium vanettenii 77-13-4]|uniref:Uncharacterized protein n=1 Tax=Fusarium vanettenii (strain ATCC MYA-4622 / CBS 123669 / FGSC 9596 / NRRL 45880 / 77-13-4) TaxID=660122 RepID=C7ZKH3_FUSV7|nr:uncharacterized protein NECHADRAFT_88966 [Fusarium vanettenii 77-13-4]EEU35485.1 predicted protein [Fusarium vanettenii 77-13-4]